MARCLLIESKLDETWWESARDTSGYIYNRVVTSTNEPPPYSLFYGSRDSLSHLRIFGSKAYVNIPLQLRNSDHSPISNEGILVGYGDQHLKSYKIYIPSLNIMWITNDVIFQEYDENGVPYKQIKDGVVTPIDPIRREISEFKYLIGTLHRDDEDGLIYITKQIKKNSNNEIYVIRQVMGNNNKPIGKLLHNDPIQVSTIVKLTNDYKNEVENSTRGVLNPKIFEDLNGIPSEVFYTTSLSKKRKLPTTSVQDVNVDAVKAMRFLNQVSVKTINCLPFLTFPDPKSPDISSSSSAPASSLSKSSTSTFPDISSISSNNTSHRVGQYCIDLSRQQCHVISKAITLANVSLVDPFMEFITKSNDECISDHSILNTMTTGDHNLTSVDDITFKGSAIDFALSEVPQTYAEALQDADSEHWIKAAELENAAWKRLQVGEYGDLPLNQKPIKLRWVFARKPPDRYKARVVAKGFLQHHGLDFDETYSPVARLTSLRLFLSLCALLSLHVNQLDVDNAFINAELEPGVEIWVEPLPGMHAPAGKFIRLKKSLYGLKQAARDWNMNINEFLLSKGFKRVEHDICMYVRGDYSKGTLVILLLYVDDMAIGASNLKLLNQVKNDFLTKYSMKDLGVPKKILGMEIQYTLNNIFISIPQYISKMFKKYSPLFTLTTPYRTPMPVNTKLTRSMCPTTPEESIHMSTLPYREIVGVLLWCAILCRPDISYAVNQLAKYNSNPGREHWMALQRVLIYLYHNREWGIEYTGPRNQNEEYKTVINFGSWADANFSTDPDTSLSTTGTVHSIDIKPVVIPPKREKGISGIIARIGETNGPVAWSSKTQSVVALSSFESEYYAAAQAVQEALAQAEMLEELNISVNKPLLIQEDNMACIWYTNHPGDYEKTKHIKRKFHFVQQHVADGDVELVYCNTTQNLADFFTKCLTEEVFLFYRSVMMRQRLLSDLD